MQTLGSVLRDREYKAYSQNSQPSTPTTQFLHRYFGPSLSENALEKQKRKGKKHNLDPEQIKSIPKK